MNKRTSSNRLSLCSMPGGVLLQVIPHTSLSAVWTEFQIFIGKVLLDLSQKRLRDEKGSASSAGFQFHGSYFMLGEDLNKFCQTYFMPQIRSVFRTGIDARTTANTLIMGVMKNSQISGIFRFERSGGTTQHAGAATRTFQNIHARPAK